MPPLPSPSRAQLLTRRLLTTSSTLSASPLPQTTPGPPPAPPKPSPHDYNSIIQRRRHQASLLKAAQDLRSAPSASKPGVALKKRFWKDVHVKTADDGSHSIFLDHRAVRAPGSKLPLAVPASKRALAQAIAAEWDLLVTAQQALKNHLIPLTSLAARARDIEAQDRGEDIPPDGDVGDGQKKPTAREDIVRVMMRYLDTDTLLCWAPVKSGMSEASGLEGERKGMSLREVQMQTALPIISFLSTRVWPGVEIHPALEETGSVLPRAQNQITREIIRGWMTGLEAWELAGLERATLAGKSLLVGARLVVEWSERSHGLRDGLDSSARFGIEEASKACSLEVSWQTGMWGEVEDTHDVEKEDLRRQMGSVVLLVSGTSRGNES